MKLSLSLAEWYKRLGRSDQSDMGLYSTAAVDRDNHRTSEEVSPNGPVPS